jgi:hypothetical protein
VGTPETKTGLAFPETSRKYRSRCRRILVAPLWLPSAAFSENRDESISSRRSSTVSLCPKPLMAFRSLRNCRRREGWENRKRYLFCSRRFSPYIRVAIQSNSGEFESGRGLPATTGCSVCFVSSYGTIRITSLVVKHVGIGEIIQ